MATNIIYFEAQTGIIRDQPSAVSSFYQYAIQVRHRVELEEAIAAATPGSTRVAVRELQYARIPAPLGPRGEAKRKGSALTTLKASA